MNFVRLGQPIKIQLKKDLARSIKQGHAWIFSDAIDTPNAPSGTSAELRGRRGEVIASGMYCCEHPIPLRVCKTRPPWALDDDWFLDRLQSAILLREELIDSQTTGYRLVSGEGDGLPGLVVDRYGRTAVIKLDAGAPLAFYQTQSIANWLANRLNLERVVFRPRGRGTKGLPLVGEMPIAPVEFLENGMRFTADVISGQKTGFFLDQRDNRHWVRSLSKGKRVLNLFSFSGGFSIAAGLGGAGRVTSVDIAAQAITACELHWQLNDLPSTNHQAVTGDCFEFTQQAASSQMTWDLVICDPPSFAPNQKSKANALNSYAKLARSCAAMVEANGLLALSSCSSHIGLADFANANVEGISRAGRQCKLVGERGLPGDHPTPPAMSELKYLKFQLFQLL